MRALWLLTLLCLPAEAAAPDAAWEVHFSPKGGCTSRILDVLSQAKHSVHVQAYSFTSRPIAAALIAAHGRGLDVQLIVDKSDEKQPAALAVADTLRTASVAVSVDRAHAIAHNKIIIIDGRIVETGSFNFTRQAEVANAENCLLLTSEALAKAYETNFALHLSHSDRSRP